MVTLQGVNEQLEEIMLSLDKILTNIQDASIDDVTNTIVCAEYMRVARKDLREAMVSVASSAEALNMLPFLIPQDAECEKKSSSSQPDLAQDSTNEPDISTNLS